MRVVTQPPGADHLCGQCSVATAAGVDLETACLAIGHQKRGGTTARELARGLRVLGLQTAGDRLRRVGSPARLPAYAIVAMSRWQGDTQLRHWMFWSDGTLCDPDGRPTEFYTRGGWRITSFLQISYDSSSLPSSGCRASGPCVSTGHAR